MALIENLGLLGMTIGGIALVFKFVLDSLGKHMQRIQDAFHDQTLMMGTRMDRLSDDVVNLRTELQEHLKGEEKQWNKLYEVIENVGTYPGPRI